MPTANILEPLTRITPSNLVFTGLLQPGVETMHPEGVGQSRNSYVPEG
jgi:hypothetical protein